MKIRADIAFILSCVLLGFTIMEAFESRSISKRVKELEEWWSAHHKAIGDTLATKWTDASAAQRWDSDSAIVLQPGESFTDTGTLGLPSWTDRYAELSKRMNRWLDTVCLPQTLPIMKSGDVYYDTTDHKIKMIP